MAIYKTKLFHRWASREGIGDAAFAKAIDEIERGLVEADLGGHVYKKRVAVGGRGKSGGARTLLAFKLGRHAFFMYGFAKNVRANVDEDELKALKHLARELLGYTEHDLAKAVQAGELIEVQA